MKNLRTLWLPLAAAAGILIFLLSHGQPSSKVAAQENPAPKAPVPMSQQEEELPKAETSVRTANPTAPTEAQKPLVELMPKPDTVRAEIEADPHTTPPSLLKFAMTIRNRFEDARKTEDDAKAFFPELETCALDRDAAESIQAYCLLDAKRLSDSYSSLAAGFHSLESRADARALKIMKAMSL